MKLHENEIDVDAGLVERLVADQFPAMRALPLTPVRSTGTVNHLFRLGDRLCVRLPRGADWAEGLQREWRWLPDLAGRLPLHVPEPVALGEATQEYPLPWAIYRWIDGVPYTEDGVTDEIAAAADLAGFVQALRGIDVVAEAPRAGRKPLADLDAVTREAIASADGVIDGSAAAAAWDAALTAPAWNDPPVWIHDDLLPPNLLLESGRLHAVLDFGGVGVGDPAADVVPAWSVFGPEGRDHFRSVLGVDDGTWARARGYALHQAALIIPYYPETNPDFVTVAVRTVREVLADR